MSIINFEFSTSNFDHATEVAEKAFGYEGEEWKGVKVSRDMDVLAEFIEFDDVDVYLLPST